MERSRKSERGVALLFSLFALFLLTAIAVGLIYMTSTDSTVNANYKSDQALYFAAKAGIEEARNRMMVGNPNNLFTCTTGPNSCLAPPAMPGTSANGLLYILGGRTPTTSAVQFYNNPSLYGDNELCHDGYPGMTALGVTPQGSDVPCSGALPSGSSWYSTTTSTSPFAATAAALPFQWVRVAQKVNSTDQTYPVNNTLPASQSVCYDGSEEVVLPVGLSDCSKMPSTNPPNSAATPVFVLTSLAVNSLTGARRMLQSEVALAPAPPFPYGMFATSNACAAVDLGGGAVTNSYTTANGGTYTTTVTNTGGDVGANGNVTATGNSQIGGSVGVPQATQGACPGNGFTVSGGAGMVNNPQNQLTQITPYTFPAPPMPNPLPPTTTYTAGSSMLPGTYGNVVVSSGTNLTLTTGTYNLNSLTLQGNATITVNGPVVINIAGVGQSTPVDLVGSGNANCPTNGNGNGNGTGSNCNTTAIPNNLQINYGGSGTVKISGGTQASIIVNAPLANVMIKGGTDLYGAVVGYTIDDSGGVNFHYDRNTKFGPPNNGSYTELSFRELMY